MLLRDVECMFPRLIVLVDHVIAVAKQFARPVRLRSGSPSSAECQDEVLLTLEAAAIGHLLDRQALVVEQILGLHHSPLDDQRTQVHSREQEERIIQEPSVGVEEQGDVSRALCPGLANRIQHCIDDHFPKGYHCVVHFLHAFYDMFHCFAVFKKLNAWSSCWNFVKFQSISGSIEGPNPTLSIIFSPPYKGGVEYLNTWGGMGAPRLILHLTKKIVSLFDKFWKLKSTAIQPFTEVQCKFTKKSEKKQLYRG